MTFCFHSPKAFDDAYFTDEAAPLFVLSPGVLENDIDQDTEHLDAYLETDVDIGTLTLDYSGAFLYEPEPDFIGTSFTYAAFDGVVYSDPATVKILPMFVFGDGFETGSCSEWSSEVP